MEYSSPIKQIPTHLFNKPLMSSCIRNCSRVWKLKERKETRPLLFKDFHTRKMNWLDGHITNVKIYHLMSLQSKCRYLE